MKKPSRWPWLIVALLSGFVVMSGWSFYRASREGSAVTDRDYYSHGLRYNQTLLERQAATSLGWQTTSQLQGRLLTIHLRDRDQRDVAGAVATLTLLGSGKAPSLDLPLREGEPGTSRANIPDDLHGEHPAEIAFQRDGARLNQRLLLAFR